MRTKENKREMQRKTKKLRKTKQNNILKQTNLLTLQLYLLLGPDLKPTHAFHETVERSSKGCETSLLDLLKPKKTHAKLKILCTFLLLSSQLQKLWQES